MSCATIAGGPSIRECAAFVKPLVTSLPRVGKASRALLASRERLGNVERGGRHQRGWRTAGIEKPALARRDERRAVMGPCVVEGGLVGHGWGFDAAAYSRSSRVFIFRAISAAYLHFALWVPPAWSPQDLHLFGPFHAGPGWHV